MKLDAKQKRIAVAVGIGALLGLLVLLRRGGGGGGGGDATPVSPSPDASAGGLPGSSTFADNGAALGELNTTLTGLAGTLDQLPGAVAAQVAQTQPQSSVAGATDTTAPAVPDATTPGQSQVTINVGAGVGGKHAKSKASPAPRHRAPKARAPRPRRGATKPKPRHSAPPRKAVYRERVTSHKAVRVSHAHKKH